MNFSEFLAAFGLIFTTVVGFWLIVPRLATWGKVYYLFLMLWTVPYAIGYACDKAKVGPYWVRWHLLDLSYAQWATTLGVSVFVVVATILKKLSRSGLRWRLLDVNYTQRTIVVVSGISLVAFLLMAYGWETAQVVEAWQKYSRVDWSDDIYYTVGLAVTAAPFIALRRFLATSAQTV